MNHPKNKRYEQIVKELRAAPMRPPPHVPFEQIERRVRRDAMFQYGAIVVCAILLALATMVWGR